MPTYIWKGKTLAGEVQTGELTMGNQEEVLAHLRKKRIITLFVREKPKQLSLSLKLRGASGVSTKDLAIFTRQFATMINAGLPLVQCLDILSSQVDNASFKTVLASVMNSVESGSTLAEALRQHPKVFDNLFVNMVEAGEAGGILDVILLRLATYIEKAEALRRKIKGAMTYPVVVLSVAVSTTIFMLLFIIPTFAKIFQDFGANLPLPTQIVLTCSNFLRGYWWVLLGAVVAGIIFYRRYVATESGRRNVDKLMLKIPALGDVIRKGSIARFTRTLGTLISSGVPILDGLEITANTAGNKVIEDAIRATRGSIREGETIAAPLRTSDAFPPMVVQMIAVGEETGALDEMLNKIALFYEDEVNTAVETLTSIIEPVMIVVMGLLVGGMVVAMYMPMFKMVSVVSGE
ncbi:MAG: type II secretion system F family protein [Candidatus Eisenbacteria bacterium]|uniref:Type II secretion system F family protein n=1 Tax=Eiseniibacteriota bacterium TaxID=2212470 RepID=A0A7Y2H3K6_UNCEI|nr:type II secretion system F family protein [Candidatus Eisenbacteria bacterium]